MIAARQLRLPRPPRPIAERSLVAGLILEYVRAHPGCLTADLIESCFVEQAAASRLTTRLRLEGLIEARREPMRGAPFSYWAAGVVGK